MISIPWVTTLLIYPPCTSPLPSSSRPQSMQLCVRAMLRESTSKRWPGTE